MERENTRENKIGNDEKTEQATQFTFLMPFYCLQSVIPANEPLHGHIHATSYTRVEWKKTSGIWCVERRATDEVASVSAQNKSIIKCYSFMIDNMTKLLDSSFDFPNNR